MVAASSYQKDGRPAPTRLTAAPNIPTITGSTTPEACASWSARSRPRPRCNSPVAKTFTEPTHARSVLRCYQSSALPLNTPLCCQKYTGAFWRLDVERHCVDRHCVDRQCVDRRCVE